MSKPKHDEFWNRYKSTPAEVAAAEIARTEAKNKMLEMWRNAGLLSAPSLLEKLKKKGTPVKPSDKSEYFVDYASFHIPSPEHKGRTELLEAIIKEMFPGAPIEELSVGTLSILLSRIRDIKAAQ